MGTYAGNADGQIMRVRISFARQPDMWVAPIVLVPAPDSFADDHSATHIPIPLFDRVATDNGCILFSSKDSYVSPASDIVAWVLKAGTKPSHITQRLPTHHLGKYGMAIVVTAHMPPLVQELNEQRVGSLLIVARLTLSSAV